MAYTDPQAVKLRIPPEGIFIAGSDPRQLDATHLKLAVERIKSDLVALDHETLALQHRREKVASALAEYGRILSAVHKAPTEVWKLIFLFTLPEYHDAIISAIHSPLILTHVCEYWRTVAIGTPGLWASIHIPIITPTHAPPSRSDSSSSLPRDVYNKYLNQCASIMANREAILRIWLRRAKDAALSITVEQSSPRVVYTHRSNYSPGGAGDIPSIIALLRSYAGQWKSLRLHCRPLLTDFLLRDVQPSLVPNLRSVIFSDGIFSQSGHPYSSRDMNNIPLLQSPNITCFRPPPLEHGTTWPARFAQLRICVGGLTTLYTPDSNGKVSTTEVLALLALCPLLVRLRVYTTCKQPHISLGDQAPVRLAHLEDLTWKEDDRDSPVNGPRETSLLSFLDIPSLHTLSLYFPRHYSTETDVEVPHPLRGLASCGEMVRTISVTMGRLPLSSFQVQNFLRFIPMVETLELSCNILPSFDRDLFNILSSVPDVSSLSNVELPLLCPKLKRLTWKSDQPDFYEKTLLTFLRSRRMTGHREGGVAKLLKLHVDILLPRPYIPRPPKDPLANQRLLADLAAMGDGVDTEGLDVDIFSWPAFPVPDRGWSPSYGTTARLEYY